jgi:integrase
MNAAKGIYTDEMQHAFKAAVGVDAPMMGLLYLLGVSTGFRVSDLLALKAGDVLLGVPMITEAKTGKLRIVVLSKDVYEDIKLYVKQHDLRTDDKLFNCSRQTVYRHFVKAAKSLGLEDFTPHGMRKTYAWNVYRITGSLHSVKDALNHKYLSVTILYLMGGLDTMLDLVYGGDFNGIQPSIGRM